MTLLFNPSSAPIDNEQENTLPFLRLIDSSRSHHHCLNVFNEVKHVSYAFCSMIFYARSFAVLQPYKCIHPLQ